MGSTGLQEYAMEEEGHRPWSSSSCKHSSFFLVICVVFNGFLGKQALSKLVCASCLYMYDSCEIFLLAGLVPRWEDPYCRCQWTIP